LRCATVSWFAGVFGAVELPRYEAAQAAQLLGMIWYFPYAPLVEL
jgi:hypothetical protein